MKDKYQNGRSRDRSTSLTCLHLLADLLDKLGTQPKLVVAFEWPKYSDGWKFLPRRLTKHFPLVSEFDGCQYGLKSSFGLPIRKSWRVIHNCESLSEVLTRKCDGRHEHQQRVRGDEATKTGRYTLELARTIVRAVKSHVVEAFPADVEEDDVAMETTGGEEADLPVQEQASLQKAVEHMHVTMGHPSNRAMARAVRLTGGSVAAIKACLEHRCSVCRRLREPKPAPAASFRDKWKEFGDCVAIDLFQLADTLGNTKTFVNAVDMASRFQIVATCESKHPRVVFATFMGVWCSWAGLPKAVLSDRGGEFNKEFSEELEAMNVELISSAAISPTQNAVCERAGGAWKFHARALLDEFNIRFTLGDAARTIWMVTVINWAMNSAIDESGYSPSQWVLGRGIKLPYQLMSERSRLALHSRNTTDRNFRERIAMLAASQRSMVALQYSAAISKAMVARSRAESGQPSSLKHTIGDQVYYFRGVGKAKAAWAHRWHGPAVVIGFEGNNLWLQHRGIAVKAAARHVRAAEPEECVPWASLLDDDVKTLNKESESLTDAHLPDVGMPPMQGGYLDLAAPQRRPREEPAPREEQPQEPPRRRHQHGDQFGQRET